jgi:ABC-2 type transport system ATP-binding protein
VGLIGPNGAGKSTALSAMLGLIPYEGELRVLGRDPWAERDRLMSDVAFIADVAILPRWMRVADLLDYVAAVHAGFDRARAQALVATTGIELSSRVRQLSKGMVAQLHLALVLSIDARLLVLDEPTLGLDLPFQKRFYDSILADYFDRARTIVIATHQVEEIQDVLTDVIVLDRGRVVLDTPMEAFARRFQEVLVAPERLEAARALGPIAKRQGVGRAILLFDGVARDQLTVLGDVRTPTLADVFVALVQPEIERKDSAA